MFSVQFRLSNSVQTSTVSNESRKELSTQFQSLKSILNFNSKHGNLINLETKQLVLEEVAAWKVYIYTPENERMSPGNQSLEDVYPIEIVPF